MDKSRSINVSLKVIADLSQGLYRSPADALKELIINAYDADSPYVNINFSRDYSEVVVKDIGTGMSIDDFITIMETIGGSDKRAEGNIDKTKSGRKIVGRIGIGLLSVSQIANDLEIESTTQGSTIGFRAAVKFDQFASEEARKIKITQLWEDNEKIEIGKYSYTELKGLDKDIHYTRLTLKNLKRTIKEKLIAKNETDSFPRMLGTKYKEIEPFIRWMGEKGVTKTGLHEYDRIFWELCVLCPVPYLDKSINVYNHSKGTYKTTDFEKLTFKINQETKFDLFVDGIRCFKPIKMPAKWEKDYPLFFNLLFMPGLNDGQIHYMDYDRNNKPVRKTINLRGYIYFQRPKIWPPELQGILIRVRNVAVGQYDSTFLTYRRHEGFKFSQITGEIYVDELDEALNIDRSSFRETDPAFVKLREAIHDYLAKSVFPGIKNYATEERGERRNTELLENEKILSNKFEKIDLESRKIIFDSTQEKLVERKSRDISLALTIKGKKINKSQEFFRIIAFLETRLEKKLTEKERDNLYMDLINWLEEF